MEQNARQILKNEFSKRSGINSRYSLRSFAKTLGMDPSVLSLVMSGKRPLSKKAAVQIANRLALTPVQSQLLLKNRKSEISPISAAGTAVYEFDKVTLDTYEVIADWVHYALLSLFEIEEIKDDIKVIAKSLKVGEFVAQTAMTRLSELGLIEKRRGRWRQTSKPIKVENTVSTAATRKFQSQLLVKAAESLEADPIEIRDFSSMTLAIDPELIPYAKERIRAFRRELTAELESRGKPKEVYNLTVQIFPVSNVKGAKS